MNEKNLALTQTILGKIGQRDIPENISQHVAEDVVMEIPGDETVMPWIGYRTGRAAFEKFLIDQRTLIEPDWFRVDDILTNDARAVIIGELSAIFAKLGKKIQTFFVIVLTFENDLVTRFQMYEDTFAGSRIAGIAADR